jgi:hypothetical protein
MELFEGSLLDLIPAACPTRPRPSRTGAIRRPTQVAAGEKPFARPVPMPKRLRHQRCNCGACGTCAENARWEKIFDEKFADHTYYDGRSPHFSSPLSEVGAG